MSYSDPSDAGQTSDEQRDEAAKLYVEQVRAFRIHAGVFAAGMAVIVLVNLLTNLAAGLGGHWSHWWSIWALIGWTSGLTIHGLVVRLNRPTSIPTT